MSNLSKNLIVFIALTVTAQAQLRQTAVLKASNAKPGDHFGNGGTLEGKGVALSGDGTTMAVGAPYESSKAKGVDGDQKDNSVYSSGAVYVFTRAGNGWAQQAYIKASNPGQSDKFGYAVSLSQDGNTLAVSAFFESSAAKGMTVPFKRRGRCMCSHERGHAGPSRLISRLRTPANSAKARNQPMAISSVSQSA
jgi:hypothetical protein